MSREDYNCHWCDNNGYVYGGIICACGKIKKSAREGRVFHDGASWSVEISNGRQFVLEQPHPLLFGRHENVRVLVLLKDSFLDKATFLDFVGLH